MQGDASPRCQSQDAFISLVKEEAASPEGLFPLRPDEERRVSIARAPGRLDVMGGISDYSGASCLLLPTAEACWAAVSRRGNGRVTVYSRRSETEDEEREERVSVDAKQLVGKYTDVSSWLRNELSATQRWATYALGCLTVLQNEKNPPIECCVGGVDIMISSNVPLGKGISSSAAIEVSVMHALADQLFDCDLEGEDLALLSQKCENFVVGAPCGIMMASSLGREDHLLHLCCSPLKVLGFIPIPQCIGLVGIDSGVRHSVGSSDYGSVRVGAFMGQKILRKKNFLAEYENLADLSPSRLMRILNKEGDGFLSAMTGKAFVEEYGSHDDEATSIEEDRLYHIKNATVHPILENWRTKSFLLSLESLQQGPVVHAIDEFYCSPIHLRNFRHLCTMGEMMKQSHESYTACGLGSDETDEIVSAEENIPMLYGGRITGGGLGGSVVVLGYNCPALGYNCPAFLRSHPTLFDEKITSLRDTLATSRGERPRMFLGSSPGAKEYGIIHMTLKISES